MEGHCWSCRAKADGLTFCSRCGALQRLPDSTDYFSCLGLAHRLKIDSKELEAKFYDLSRKFHPDFYQKRSPEEQAISLENAAILNKAYRTLKDPQRRVEYLIGLVEGEVEIATEPPSDLFDEIFELQEALEEMRSLPPGDSERRTGLVQSLRDAEEKFKGRREQEQKALESLADRWDRLELSGDDPDFSPEQKKCLKEMKKILSHRGYFERILSDIRTAIEGN